MTPDDEIRKRIPRVDAFSLNAFADWFFQFTLQVDSPLIQSVAVILTSGASPSECKRALQKLL